MFVIVLKEKNLHVKVLMCFFCQKITTVSSIKMALSNSMKTLKIMFVIFRSQYKWQTLSITIVHIKTSATLSATRDTCDQPLV